MSDTNEIPQINTGSTDSQNTEDGSSELISKISFGDGEKQDTKAENKEQGSKKPMSERRRKIKKALPIVGAVFCSDFAINVFLGFQFLPESNGC